MTTADATVITMTITITTTTANTPITATTDSFGIPYEKMLTHPLACKVAHNGLPHGIVIPPNIIQPAKQ
eukprot:4942846-Pyramimonas_sp.AAC.1